MIVRQGHLPQAFYIIICGEGKKEPRSCLLLPLFLSFTCSVNFVSVSATAVVLVVTCNRERVSYNCSLGCNGVIVIGSATTVVLVVTV